MLNLESSLIYFFLFNFVCFYFSSYTRCSPSNQIIQSLSWDIHSGSSSNCAKMNSIKSAAHHRLLPVIDTVPAIVLVPVPHPVSTVCCHCGKHWMITTSVFYWVNRQQEWRIVVGQDVAETWMMLWHSRRDTRINGMFNNSVASTAQTRTITYNGKSNKFHHQVKGLFLTKYTHMICVCSLFFLPSFFSLSIAKQSTAIKTVEIKHKQRQQQHHQQEQQQHHREQPQPWWLAIWIVFDCERSQKIHFLSNGTTIYGTD